MGCCDGQLTVKDAARGAVKLAKAVLHADPASSEVVKARLDICRECDQATRWEAKMDGPNKGLWCGSRCRKCNCFIAAKVKLAGEGCCDGLWEAVKAPVLVS